MIGITSYFNDYDFLFRKDFDKFSQVDTHAADLFKDILKRARARPDKLPVFQDITTVSQPYAIHPYKNFQVNRDYRGKYGQKADTAKPAWHPAKHPKFNSKSEMKNVSARSNWNFGV